MEVVATSSSRRKLDPAAFPRVARYVRSLPRGLLSHPECECKGSVYREGLAHLPRRMPTEGLDGLLADYFDNPMPVSSWVPEVVNTAAFLAMADAFFPTETGFLDWVGGFAETTFRSPMYRVLMAVASPEVLARGGQRRWNAFHTGTDYESVIGTNGTEVTLSYPSGAFEPLVIRGTLRAIQAAYRASGAKQATVELVDFTDTRAVYKATWYPTRP